MRRAIHAIILLAGCTEPTRLQRGLEDIDHLDAMMHFVPRPTVRTVSPSVAPVVPAPAPAPVRDRYAGAEQWCEPAVAPVCTSDTDCGELVGKTVPTKCVTPHWAKRNEPIRVCAGGWPTRRQKEAMIARLRHLVAGMCRRPDDCAQLGDVLVAVALRESTLRPWKAHRLAGDVRASAKVFEKRRAELLAAGNRYTTDPDRWGTFGLYGQQAAQWLEDIDVTAPPEVLCRVPESTIAYVNRLQRAYRKIVNGIDCDGDGERERVVPSWARLHAAASGGRICSTSDGASLRKRLRATGSTVDVAAPVRESALGRRIPDELDARRTLAESLTQRFADFSFEGG